jgi:hypothetical protein
MNMNKLEILQKIETGEMSVEEGMRLLSEIEPDSASASSSEGFDMGGSNAFARESPTSAAQATVEGPEAIPPDFQAFRVWNWAFFGFFLLVTALSAWWMISAWQNHPWGVGFWLSWIPFAIGVYGMATSFNTRWLHVRVIEKKQGDPNTIRISLPLPLGLAGWVLRGSNRWLPAGVRDYHFGEILQEVDHSLNKDQPFFVEVDEEDEQVQVFIG